MEFDARLERELPAGQGQRRPRLHCHIPDDQPPEPEDEKCGEHDPAVTFGLAHLHYSMLSRPRARIPENDAHHRKNMENKDGGRRTHPSTTTLATQINKNTTGMSMVSGPW